MTPRAPRLIDGIEAGHVPSIARAITALESRRGDFEELGEAVWQAGGAARIIGVTGAPGTGKSTLTSGLAKELRAGDRRVAIVCVDPSSSISGGAILGDRIRMTEHTADDGVYIRSLSTRGSLGGVSRATVDAVAVLDAAGYDDVIVETVGVGQAEVDIVRIAHTVLVVSVPGLGDEIQMIKAGLLELADVHVVNKADRPDANKVVAEIRGMLALGHSLHAEGWTVPIVETSATTGSGVRDLVDAVDHHTAWLRASGERERLARRGAEVRVREVVKDLVVERVQDPSRRVGYEAAIDAVADRKQSPYAAARQLLAQAHHTEESA